MKRSWKIVLVLACMLGLLTGCGTAGDRTEPPVESQPGSVKSTDAPEGTREDKQPEMESSGKIRISYTGNQSWVRYITSASQLPNYEELKVFDEDYFRTHALVLVAETVSSGTVDVEISHITVDGNRALVTLSHEMKGDFGTADMATWLLWAEVEQGLEYQWVLENPALKSNTVTR